MGNLINHASAETARMKAAEIGGKERIDGIKSYFIQNMLVAVEEKLRLKFEMLWYPKRFNESQLSRLSDDEILAIAKEILDEINSNRLWKRIERLFGITHEWRTVERLAEELEAVCLAPIAVLREFLAEARKNP